MTEQEWLSVWRSLRHNRGRANEIVTLVSKRKLRLLACACCRRWWDSLTPVSKELLLLAERHADKKAKSKSLPSNDGQLRHLDRLSRAVHEAAYRHDNPAVLIDAVCHAQTAMDVPEDEYEKAIHEEGNAQLELVRHIVGNPFRPYPITGRWPSDAIRLANAIYNGQDCGFALHDALLEAGHPELAEHFRQEQSHPKGCWVVDLVLGKR